MLIRFSLSRFQILVIWHEVKKNKKKEIKKKICCLVFHIFVVECLLDSNVRALKRSSLYLLVQKRHFRSFKKKLMMKKNHESKKKKRNYSNSSGFSFIAIYIYINHMIIATIN